MAFFVCQRSFLVGSLRAVCLHAKPTRHVVNKFKAMLLCFNLAERVKCLLFHSAHSAFAIRIKGEKTLIFALYNIPQNTSWGCVMELEVPSVGCAAV
jgi:hypothetical protein